MEINEDSTTWVLSIYPNVNGFGFSVFEGAQNPIDWGTNTVRFKKNKASLEKVERLIDFYSPEVVITENCKGVDSRRGERITALVDDIEALCKSKNQKLIKYSRKNVLDVFDRFGISTKHEIAQKICAWLPSLLPYLPPPRKPWMREDYSMAIFDAIALAVAYFYLDD